MINLSRRNVFTVEGIDVKDPSQRVPLSNSTLLCAKRTGQRVMAAIEPARLEEEPSVSVTRLGTLCLHAFPGALEIDDDGTTHLHIAVVPPIEFKGSLVRANGNPDHGHHEELVFVTEGSLPPSLEGQVLRFEAMTPQEPGCHQATTECLRA